MTMKKFKNSILLCLVMLFAVAGTAITLDAANPQVKSRKTQVKKKSTASKGTTSAKTQSTTSQKTSSNGQTFTVKGVSFKMIHVDGASFSIGMTEVTQALWKAVMGNNPSKFKGDNLPVEQVSWNDCQQFITKLNQLTGKKFRLPNVTEWEFAAYGGSKKADFSYSGSHYIDKIAWYKGNSGGTTHKVATKQPNQLGIYDMTGNVWEWCDDDEATAKLQMGYSHLSRGGCFVNEENVCLVSVKNKNYPNDRKSGLGFRLAMDNEKQIENKQSIESKKMTPNTPDVQTFTIKDVEFKMIKVKGEVEGVSYYIGMTEVTQGLWEAVMGENNNTSKIKGKNLPLQRISYVKFEDFIKRLNELTGKQFYLPNKNEWLYAAFGGKKKNLYSYSGSDNINEVAWYNGNSNETPHEVGMRMPNQLGIYDMTGNVRELCVIKSPSSLGQGVDITYVYMGGSYADNSNNCLFTSSATPQSDSSLEGYRLAMVDN